MLTRPILLMMLALLSACAVPEPKAVSCAAVRDDAPLVARRDSRSEIRKAFEEVDQGPDFDRDQSETENGW